MTVPMRARNINSGGFSLLEALVAMAIASIAFGTLYRVVGQGAKTVGDVGGRVEAAMVARSVLASATYAEDFVSRGSGGSDHWFWRAQVAPEQVLFVDKTGREVGAFLSVGRVSIDVLQSESGVPVFSLTAWKPYRSAP